jgi:hypothetical protein
MGRERLRGGTIGAAGTLAPRRGVGLLPCGSSPSRAAGVTAGTAIPRSSPTRHARRRTRLPRGWAGNAWGRGPLVRNAARRRASPVAAVPDIQPSSRVRLGDAGEAARAPREPAATQAKACSTAHGPAARSATVRKPEAYPTLCRAGGRTLRGGSVCATGPFAPRRGVGLPPCGSSPSRAAKSDSRDGYPTVFAQAECEAPHPLTSRLGGECLGARTVGPQCGPATGQPRGGRAGYSTAFAGAIGGCGRGRAQRDRTQAGGMRHFVRRRGRVARRERLRDGTIGAAGHLRPSVG